MISARKPTYRWCLQCMTMGTNLLQKASTKLFSDNDINFTIPPDAEMLDLRGTTGVTLAANNSLNFSINSHLNVKISLQISKSINFFIPNSRVTANERVYADQNSAADGRHWNQFTGGIMVWHSYRTQASGILVLLTSWSGRTRRGSVDVGSTPICWCCRRACPNNKGWSVLVSAKSSVR